MSISSVTSEALQLKLRQLLPSQQGFGTDLSASDTIIPVIDLTASAEGSDVRPDLQTAIAFGSATAISVTNASQVIANTPGFYRIFGSATVSTTAGALSITMTDGATVKTIFLLYQPVGNSTVIQTNLDFVVFLAAGESITAVSNATTSNFNGSVRQIADVNGTLVQPVGFNPS